MNDQAVPVQIDFPEDFYMFTCPECKMHFAYIAVLPQGEEYGKMTYSWMHQVKCSFCPYCGYAMRITYDTE